MGKLSEIRHVAGFVDVCVCVRAQRKHQEIRAMRSQLKKIEDLGAAMEEALILDNKYTEHSTVGLAQQWDQLDQLGMRMQHNLEQQIQARCTAARHRDDLQFNINKMRSACRWWSCLVLIMFFPPSLSGTPLE